MSIINTELTDKQINHLIHSLGVSIVDKTPKDFYRNYSFYYEKENECEKLVKLGYMSNHQRGGSEIYHVTSRGIELVKSLLK